MHHCNTLYYISKFMCFFSFIIFCNVMAYIQMTSQFELISVRCFNLFFVLGFIWKLLSHQLDYLSMTMSGCQVQWGVVTAIGRIDTSASLNQQLHQFCVAFLRSPVQRTEAVIISAYMSKLGEWQNLIVCKRLLRHSSFIKFMLSNTS